MAKKVYWCQVMNDLYVLLRVILGHGQWKAETHKSISYSKGHRSSAIFLVGKWYLRISGTFQYFEEQNIFKIFIEAMI